MYILRREKEKAPESVCFRGFCVIATGFDPSPLPIARKGECEGGTLAGSPARVQSPARRRALLRSKSAAPETKPPLRGGFVSVITQHYRFFEICFKKTSYDSKKNLMHRTHLSFDSSVVSETAPSSRSVTT